MLQEYTQHDALATHYVQILFQVTAQNLLA